MDAITCLRQSACFGFFAYCLLARIDGVDARTQDPATPLRRSGFLGVVLVPVPDPVRTELELPPDVGVLVQSTVDCGSARAAGIIADDVITAVNGRRVGRVAEFVDLVRSLRAGDVLRVTVRRGKEDVILDVVVTPRPYESAPDVQVRYDAVSVDGTQRRTIVTAPSLGQRHPAILYLTGIGCFSQESLDLSSNDTKLLYGLTRAGYVTMRLEKSGIGDSEGPACDSPSADFRAEIRAYTAALRALKRYSFVDPSAVVLIGLSIGGVEAPLVAADERTAGVVVLNTVAKPLFEYLLETRRRQLALAQIAYDEADRSMALEARCNGELLLDKKSPATILASTAACKDHIEFPAPYTFMQQWADLSPAAAWKAVTAPVLVMYGTSDFVATIGDQPYLAAMINAFHPGMATTIPIPGMDHQMNKADRMEESFVRKGPGEFELTAVGAIADWLGRVVPPR